MDCDLRMKRMKEEEEERKRAQQLLPVEIFNRGARVESSVL